MKYPFALLTLTLMLVSCGTMHHRKLRFVNVGNSEVVLVDDVHTDTTILSEASYANETSTSIETTERQTDADVDELSTPRNSANGKNFQEVSTDDSLETDTEEIINRALNTEKMAMESTAFLAGGIIGFIVPFLGLILFILGVSKYINTRKEQYNTVKGERYLDVSTILLVINSLFIALAFFTIVLILAFVF
jgi:hypothetical protein